MAAKSFRNARALACALASSSLAMLTFCLFAAGSEPSWASAYTRSSHQRFRNRYSVLTFNLQQAFMHVCRAASSKLQHKCPTATYHQIDITPNRRARQHHNKFPDATHPIRVKWAQLQNAWGLWGLADLVQQHDYRHLNTSQQHVTSYETLTAMACIGLEKSSSSAARSLASCTTSGGKLANSATWMPKDWSHAPGLTWYSMVSFPEAASMAVSTCKLATPTGPYKHRRTC